MTSSKEWTELRSSTNTDNPPKYPFVSSTYTNSGHSFTFNDNPDQENIRLQHRSGSFFEFHPKGDLVLKVVGKDYQVICNENKIKIKKNCTIDIEEDLALHVKQNVYLKVEGDWIEEISGDIIRISKNNQKANAHTTDGDKMLSATGDIILNPGTDETTTGKVIINGDVQVNGTIRATNNISAEMNISASQDVMGARSIRTSGVLLVGPVSSLMGIVDLPLPGFAIIDANLTVGAMAEVFGSVLVGGSVNVGGMITALDQFYYLSGVLFSEHIHPEPDGVTGIPI